MNYQLINQSHLQLVEILSYLKLIVEVTLVKLGIKSMLVFISEVKALLIGPGSQGSSSNHFEILTLPLLQHSNCTLPTFPESIWGYQMSANHIGVQVCGGNIEGIGFTSECFLLPYNGKSWLRSPDIPSMKERRYIPGSVTLPGDQWWITGGWNAPVRYASTEVQDKDGTWTTSINLPAGLQRHCMVKIDENRILMTGGVDTTSKPHTFTYLYDTSKNDWETVESMEVPRYAHSCALIEVGKVIVVGGIGRSGERLSSSEIFNVAENSWKAGPELPVWTFTAQMITIDGVSYYIGGRTSDEKRTTDIYRLNKINSEWRFKKVGNLSKGKAYFDVAEIKLSTTDCNGWI